MAEINLVEVEKNGSFQEALKIAREFEAEKDILSDKIRQLEEVIEGKKVPIMKQVANTINDFRIFPRGLIAGYFVLIAMSVSTVLGDPDTSIQTAGLLAVLTGALAPIMSSYMNTPKV